MIQILFAARITIASPSGEVIVICYAAFKFYATPLTESAMACAGAASITT